MQFTALGDMARSFNASRVNADIRTRLDDLAAQLSTGLKSDVSQDLGAEAKRVPEVQRQLSLSRSQVSLALQLGQRLEVMQAGIETVSRIGSNLFDQASLSWQSASDDGYAALSDQGRSALEDAVAALNTRFAGSSLFAGTAEDRPAIATAEEILADIGSSVAGSTTAVDLLAAVDGWFDDTGGGFDTIAYLGDSASIPVRRIDDLTTVEIAARGDDPAFRDLLKSAVLAQVAGDFTLALSGSDRDAVARRAGEEALAATSRLAELGGRVGMSEQRVEDARVRLTAQSSSLELYRNDLMAADPFETAAALQEVQIQLETHYAVTARLSQLSLTRYL